MTRPEGEVSVCLDSDWEGGETGPGSKETYVPCYDTSKYHIGVQSLTKKVT